MWHSHWVGPGVWVGRWNRSQTIQVKKTEGSKRSGVSRWDIPMPKSVKAFRDYKHNKN
jgi:hypothetical protein